AARAAVELDWKANPQPLRRLIAGVEGTSPSALERIADSWFLCALAERDSANGLAALKDLGDSTFGDNAIQFSAKFGEGLLARAVKDEARAHAAFTAARIDQEKLVQAQADYGPSLMALALIDAGLGRKQEALREGRRAEELMPLTKDATNGAAMIEFFGVLSAWVGDKDIAFENLTQALDHDSVTTTSYGRLKLLPWWDPLRGDPRFEKIVNSLAPK
ncbi:MAG: hypothetical protein ACJ8M1_13015, partial [Chthoniobacterales bacterium]